MNKKITVIARRPKADEALTPLVTPASGLIRNPLTVPSGGRDEATPQERLLRALRALAMTGWIVGSLFGASLAYAGEYDIKIMTPAIQQAIQGRQARYAQLDQFKQTGALGENNQGYVEVLQASPAAESVAQAENYDRRVIYEAIVEQNNLSPAGMANVQAVFGEVQRGKAQPGQWIQSRTGEWTRK